MRRKRDRIVLAVVIVAAIALFFGWYWSQSGNGGADSIPVVEQPNEATIAKSHARPADIPKESLFAVEGAAEIRGDGACLQLATDDLDDSDAPWSQNPPDILAVADFLFASRDPEHKMVAAMLTVGEDNFGTRADRFEVLFRSNSNDAVLLRLIHGECTQKRFEDRCDESAVEQRLIASDSTNADMWARVAGRRARLGDLDGALRAIDKAASAPEMDTYFRRYFGIVFRGLSAAGAGNDASKFIAAITYASTVSTYQGLFRVCDELSGKDDRWYSSCLAFGERLDSQAQSEMDRALGLALQHVALQESDNHRRKKEVEEKRAARKAKRDERMENIKLYAAFDEVFFSNSQHVTEYMERLINEDEFSAAGWLVEHRDTWLAAGCPSSS